MTIDGGPAAKTNAQGIATIANVPPGNQKVAVGNGKAQFIAVKALPGATAATPQSFTLVAAHNSAAWYAATIGVVFAVVVLVALLWQQRKRSAALPRA